MTTLSPWRPGHLIGLWLTTMIGMGLIALAWYGTSGRTDLGEQMPFLESGILGVVAMGVADGLWLLRGRRAVGERRARLLPMVEERDASAQAPFAPIQRVDTAPVAASGAMTHYHRTDCDLVYGKDVLLADPAAHAASGRRPCPICSP